MTSSTQAVPNQSDVNTMPVGAPPESAVSAQGGTHKALGGAQADPALANWYQEAYAYYQSMMSGQEPMLDQASLNQLLEWMNWAAQQLGLASSWDPTGGTSGAGNTGPANSFFYDTEEATVNPLGTDAVHDSFAYETTVNIPSTADKVEYSMTMDERTDPPEQVLKIVITHAHNGTKEVIYIHNPDKAKVTINTPRGENVTALNGADSLTNADGDPLVTVGEYKGSAGSSNESASSVPGESIDVNGYDQAYEYEVGGNGTIDFWPQGEPGDPTYHKVWGNANIVIPAKGTVDVQIVNGKLVATVYDENGQPTDVYELQKDYHTLDLQGHHQDITFNGQPSEGKVPGAFQGRVMINGESAPGISFKPGVFAEFAGIDNKAYPDMVQELAELFGIPASELAEKLYAQFGELKKYDKDGNGKLSPSELQKAIDEKAFPPSIPDHELIEFMANNDPTLANLLEAVKNASPESVAYTAAMKQVSERLVELLNTLYPGKVSMHAPESNDWRYANNLLFDGMGFEAFSEKAGHLGDVSFHWWENM